MKKKKWMIAADAPHDAEVLQRELADLTFFKKLFVFHVYLLKFRFFVLYCLLLKKYHKEAEL